ncbi:MAG: 5-dehydro-4-deoxy-D-glucuronate isomerase [Sphaerochaetaceae bacterium]|nr:5-dehydro-4-deoxy-D-glucuronate isomerase [Sphaerochaetaceae bacterium]MDC7237291.1 5-dehydro-4-deoxy-D-glucuronate isomerase [Sphaerochaetaceae bacterium]MDC7250623.1 5-dehydro-4-deoxy-D-glucuronate isomerase [Sphaerochaetaceae bacterium]
MDIRYSTGKEPFKTMTTEQLRKEFLIQNIFVENDVTSTYSHVDRIVTLGAMPTNKEIALDKNIDAMGDFGVNFFLERRELGIINIGEEGSVKVDGKNYTLKHYDALYLPMGTKEVLLSSANSKAPAKFYMNSTPAHTAFPAKLITLEDAKHLHLGSLSESNERTINQYIHPDVLDTCQLSMGLTHLEEGSVWNTMPAHTHERRMEVYFYFDVPDDQVVFHFMGEPSQTRHIVMHNEEAVINPSWSIHAGSGTKNYTFIWSMAGENRTYSDQDHIKTTDLR